jgi:hypothetical protein
MNTDNHGMMRHVEKNSMPTIIIKASHHAENIIKSTVCPELRKNKHGIRPYAQSSFTASFSIHKSKMQRISACKL